MLALVWLAFASFAQAQTPPVLIQEVISREFSIFVGDEPTPPWRQAVSREVSIVVTTPAWPAKVSPLIVTPTPTGESVTLSWLGYNEWAQRDVAGYRLYISDRPFTDISQMTNYIAVPGETFTFTFTNLPAWQDHYFAVVAVDALEGFDPVVNYAAAYVLAREVVSREFSVFIGAEPDPPWRQVASREVSIVVTTPEVPAQVTPLSVTPTPTGETVTLSWLGYNEWAQRDVTHYDIYLSPRVFTDVSQMTPYATVRGETFTLTLTNLSAWEDHFFAVVAVDALGGSNAVVRYAAANALAREAVSREFSVFVGAEPDPPWRQVASREVSIVVTTATAPAPVPQLVVNPVPARQTAALSWAGYNEWAQGDIVRYDIYMFTRSGTNGMQVALVASVPGETFSITLTNLSAGEDHFFAVVAVDALGRFRPAGSVEPGSYLNGVFSVFVNNPLGAEFVLLESSDLRNWVRLQTNTAAGMPYAMSVTNVPGLNRFYRLLIR